MLLVPPHPHRDICAREHPWQMSIWGMSEEGQSRRQPQAEGACAGRCELLCPVLEQEATGLRGRQQLRPERSHSHPPVPSPPRSPCSPESQPILQQLAILPSHAPPTLAQDPYPRDSPAGLYCPVELGHQSCKLEGGCRLKGPQNQPPASSPTLLA